MMLDSAVKHDRRFKDQNEFSEVYNMIKNRIDWTAVDILAVIEGANYAGMSTTLISLIRRYIKANGLNNVNKFYTWRNDLTTPKQKKTKSAAIARSTKAPRLKRNDVTDALIEELQYHLKRGKSIGVVIAYMGDNGGPSESSVYKMRRYLAYRAVTKSPMAYADWSRAIAGKDDEDAYMNHSLFEFCDSPSTETRSVQGPIATTNNSTTVPVAQEPVQSASKPRTINMQTLFEVLMGEHDDFRNEVCGLTAQYIGLANVTAEDMRILEKYAFTTMNKDETFRQQMYDLARQTVNKMNG